MQDRVNKRPLLFEQQTQITARRAAERKYADILRSAGVDEKLVQNLVTKDGKIVDGDSDDEFEESGSRAKYGSSRHSSGAELSVLSNQQDSYGAGADDTGSDVSEEIDEEEEISSGRRGNIKWIE